MDLGLNETYNLGLDFGSRYLEELQAVTAQQVLTAARKYIHPDHYVMVTVGAKPTAPPESPPAPPASQTESPDASAREAVAAGSPAPSAEN
jgi:zinc protease